MADDYGNGERRDPANANIRALRTGLDNVTKQVGELATTLSGLQKALTQQVEKEVQSHLRGHVSWPALGGILVAFCALVVSLVGALTSPTKDAVKDLKQETAVRLDKVDAKVETMKTEAQKAKLEATSVRRVIVDGYSRKDAKAELKKKTEELDAGTTP